MAFLRKENLPIRCCTEDVSSHFHNQIYRFFEMAVLLVLHTLHVGGLFNCKLYHHSYKSIICTSLWHLMFPDRPKLTRNYSSLLHTLQILTSPLIFYSLLRSFFHLNLIKVFKKKKKLHLGRITFICFK